MQKNIQRNSSKVLALVCMLWASLSLMGCANRHLPSLVVYDFGPGTLQAVLPTRMASLHSLALPPVQTTRALDGTSVYYRLHYKDAQQPKAYAQARWSMPVGELIDQKLRYQLGQNRHLLNPQDNLQLDKNCLILNLQLDEFSQVFEAPDKSVGLLKMRATLSEPQPRGARLLAQRSFTVQQVSTTPDAAGGVHALTSTVELLGTKLEQWVQQQPPR